MFLLAYELRIRDDETFKPESNFPPLESKRLVRSMFVDSIVMPHFILMHFPY